MDYKILTSSSSYILTKEVNEHIEKGWKPIGGHGVVNTHSQNKFAGSQHMATVHSTEYSQTMIKE